jgi:hypothetical protein
MQCAAARRTCADRAAPPLQRRAAPPTAVHAVMTAAPPAPQRRTADEYPRLANTRSECQYTRSGGRMQTHAQHASHIALVSKCVLFGHPPNAVTAVSATAAPKCVASRPTTRAAPGYTCESAARMSTAAISSELVCSAERSCIAAMQSFGPRPNSPTSSARTKVCRVPLPTLDV